jgi:response regulator RpfG family c-di-GMP phosphodiesterase
MVLATMALTLSEHFARIYSGDVSEVGFIITRTSKFLHYGLNLLNIYIFSLYVKDMLRNEGKIKKMPKCLAVTNFVLIAGAINVIISQFVRLYYYYDADNIYHRARFYGISYIYSSVTIAILAATIVKHRKIFSKKLFLPFLMFTLAPMVTSILHLVFHSFSLVSTTIVAMTVLLYCFSIIDANEVTENAKKKELRTIKLMLSQTASALAEAIDAKDPYTSGHSKRVAEYSAEIAAECGMSEEECSKIYMIGLLHDVGKIGIPGTIINKPGKLTDEEYQTIKTHPTIGREILSEISSLPDLADGASYHHERYDGKGYPNGLKGEDIPESARIVAVADSFDAMTSERSYRKGLPKEVVREELIKGMGTQFDEKYASAMIKIMDKES